MFKWKSILVGMGLILLLILTASSIVLSSADPGPGNNPGLNYPPGKEVSEARSAHTKLFRTGDNSNTLFISMMPLHFQDKQGSWQEIDTTLQDAAGETDEDGELYGYCVVKNTFQTYLPRHNKGWTQLRSGDCRLAFRLISNDITERPFTRNKYSIHLNDAFPQCDLNLTVKNSGVKEEIVLKDRTAPREFKYQIRVHNLNMSKSAAGDILFSDNQGNNVFIMPKFFMYDANNTLSEDINANLEEQGNGYLLTITPSQEWLNDSGRVYPVTIDPTTIQIDGWGGDPATGGRMFYYLPAIDFVNLPRPRIYSLVIMAAAPIFT